MPQLIVTTQDGETRELDVEGNRTVMEIIREKGVGELLALCGGCCSCATCHVYVDADYADRLPPMSADEDALLSGSDHRRAPSRLSCQIPMTDALDGLRVTIAPAD
jgi:ferredoxin, 2Fe-2S